VLCDIKSHTLEAVSIPHSDACGHDLDVGHSLPYVEVIEKKDEPPMLYTITVTYYGRSRTWERLTEAQAKRLLHEAGFNPNASVKIEKEAAA
jgi:hypothetical protein